MGAIRELLRNFVVDNFILDPDDEAFTDEADLKESGILDSLAMLKFITFIEDQFAVELQAEDLQMDGLFSVVNLERLVELRNSCAVREVPS